MEMKTLRVPATVSPPPPLPLPVPGKLEEVTVLGSGMEVEAKPRSSLKTAGQRAHRSVQISEEYWVERKRDRERERDGVTECFTFAADLDLTSADVNAGALSSTMHPGDWSAISVDSSKLGSATEKPLSEGKEEEGEEKLPSPLPFFPQDAPCSPSAAATISMSMREEEAFTEGQMALFLDLSHLPPPPPLRPSPSKKSNADEDKEMSLAPGEVEGDIDVGIEGTFSANVNANGCHDPLLKATHKSSSAEVDHLTGVLMAAPLALSNRSVDEEDRQLPLLGVDAIPNTTVRAVGWADPGVLPTIRSSEVSPEDDSGCWCETVLIRLSFLGLPEAYDEWHSVGNGRIAPLDSRSFGKRGDSPLREEVVFIVTTQFKCLIGNESANNIADIEDRRIRRFTLPRSSQSYHLYSPALMEVVNIFGESQGFESLLNYLQEIRSVLEVQCGSCSSSSSSEPSAASATPSPSLWTPLICSIVNSLGSLHRMLSPQFLLYLESKQLLYTASYLLRNMDQRDLRETPVELIETALTAIEGISGSVSSAATKIKTESETNMSICPISVSTFSIADVLYDITMRYLECPYLNRRLAGLKMLTDLFKRVQATAAHPSGLIVTKTTFGANDGVSYRVVPLLPHLSITALSASVAGSGVLFSVFRGERAHESLMLRSVEILRMLLHEGCLDDSVLTAIWEAGCQQRERAAMGVLTDIIALMSASNLSFLFNTALNLIAPAAATVEVADVLSAMAIRCRALVMSMSISMSAPTPSSSCDKDYLMSVPTSRVGNGSDLGIPPVSSNDPESERAVLDLHKQVSLKLWCWAEDGSGATDQVAVRCLSKLLEAVDIGSSVTTTSEESSSSNSSKDFPWGRQWQRTEALVLCALQSLAICRSIAPAVRLLEAFMCSWPLYAHSSDTQLQLAPTAPLSPFPFAAPTRAAVAEYLESEYRISTTMGICIGSLKSLFNDSVQSISSPQHTGTGAGSDSGRGGEEGVAAAQSGMLSEELQAVLNEVMVGGSRVGFKEELMRSLDFLHEFLRCSESLMFSQGVIESIWRDVACQAVTAEEVNLVMKFLSRLILNASPTSTLKQTGPDTPMTMPTSISCLPCNTRDCMLPMPRSTPTPAASTSVPTSVSAPMGVCLLKGKTKAKRKALCTLEAVQFIFKNMLCDKVFVLSPFYSLQAFNCTKKFFRWLNTDAGLMSEASPLPLSIVGTPSSLIGMEVFSDIITSCRWDSVASHAITFLTSLPLCLAAPLVEAGELVALRRLLLQQCTDQLAQAATGTVDPRTLTRLIMLLSGLLDESQQDKGPSVRSHGSMGRGAEVIVHISGTNKIKCKSGSVTMHSNDTLGDLFSEVSTRMGIAPGRLKIFRLAKEVNLLDSRKTLAQMRFGLSGSEQMLVSERAVTAVPSAPLVSSKTLLDGSNEENSASNMHPSMKRSLSADDSPVTSAIDPVTNTSLSPSISGECAASSSDAESAPATTLSLSHDKLEMLFSLMESSQLEVVDKIWDLVTRLPSSPSMLTAWLQLAEPSALHLLFHHPTHSCGPRLFLGTSVARLLYNLQIIEALLQHACKGEDKGSNVRNTEATDRDRNGDGGGVPMALASDSDYSSSVPILGLGLDDSPLISSSISVSDWPVHFLSKGGVSAVCGAFDWLSSFMQVSSLETAAAYGSSSGLVLQLFEITVRLMRSLLVRSAAASLADSGDSTMLLRLLRSLQGRRDFNPAAVSGSTTLPRAVSSPTSISSMSPPFVGPMLPPPLPLSPPLHLEAEPTDISAVDHSLHCMSDKKKKEGEEIEQLLHQEWCRTLSTNGHHLSANCTQSESLDMSRVQSTTVSLMMSLRRFSSADIFQNGSLDWAATTTMRARRRLLYSVLDGLFAVWSVTAMTKPDILSNLFPSNPLDTQIEEEQEMPQRQGDLSLSMEIFLARLILGVDVDGKHAAMKGDTEDLVAKWARQELESFLHFLSQLRSPLPLSLPMSDDPYHSHCEGFRRRVFRAFLALRPPLVSPRPSHPSTYSASSASRPSLPPISAAMLASASSVKEFFSLGVSLLGGSVMSTTTTTPRHAEVGGQAENDKESDAGMSVEAGSSVILSSQERMQISLELYDELQAAADCHLAHFKRVSSGDRTSAVTASAGTRELHSHFLGGTISTLHGLVNCSAHLLTITHSTAANARADANACGHPPQSPLSPPPSSPVMLQVFYEKGFVKFLLVDCLGLRSVSSESAPPSLCNDDQSRAAAYAILRAMTEWLPVVVHEVLRHLTPVYASFPPLSAWDFKPERDVRSVTGFVGLRNKGCTCYMNSLLQVLYMTPEVRQGILLAKTTSYDVEDEEAAKNDLVLQLQKLFFNLKYGERKAFTPDDWVFAYKDESGLRPVNVLQQQDAQEFIQVLCERLSAQQSIRETPALPADAASSSSTASTLSEHPSAPSSASVEALLDRDKDRNGGNGSVSIAPSSPSSMGVGDLVKNAFGGRICNIMQRQEPAPQQDMSSEGSIVSVPVPNNSSARDTVREQEDAFVCLSMQVKGAKGLEHSLALFVESECIDDFKWEDEGPRVTISKRQCISQLSDNLIFHLKRFELNFDTFRREKVNDCFSFPMYLNMLPFTKEGLKPLSPSDSHSPLHPSSYYQYELTGVVVHTGTTDSGHYYAYIKDSNRPNGDPPFQSAPFPSSSSETSSVDLYVDGGGCLPGDAERKEEEKEKENRWFEFNDSEVSVFSEASLDAECFGGTTKSYDYSVSTISKVEAVNPKSAYMLVYRRTVASPPTVSPPSYPGTVESRVSRDDGAAAVIRTIKIENARHTMAMRLADSWHLEAMSALIRTAAGMLSSSSLALVGRPALNGKEGEERGEGHSVIVASSRGRKLLPSPLPLDIFEGLLAIAMDFAAYCSPSSIAREILDLLATSATDTITRHSRAPSSSSPPSSSSNVEIASDCTASNYIYEVDARCSDGPAEAEIEDESSLQEEVPLSMDNAVAETEPKAESERQQWLEGEGEGEGMEEQGNGISMPCKRARLVNKNSAGNSSAVIDIDIDIDIGIGTYVPPLYGAGGSSSSCDVVQATAIGLAKKVANKGSFDRVVALLYCPDQATRLSYAKLLFRAFELMVLSDGAAAFSVKGTEAEAEASEDLLNADLAFSPSSFSFGSRAQEDKRHQPVSSNGASSAEGVKGVGLDDEDEEIAMAIKLSMQSSSDLEGFPSDPAVPLAVAVPILAEDEDDAQSRLDSGGTLMSDMESVVEMTYLLSDSDITEPPVIADAVPCSIAASALASAPALRAGVHESKKPVGHMDVHASFPHGSNSVGLSSAARFLLELTRDARMQLIAENWRRADAVTWLLLSICQSCGESRLKQHVLVDPPLLSSKSESHRMFLLHRQLLPQLVSIFTGDVSAVKGTVGSRKTAPSSNVLVGPPGVRGGPDPASSKNIPDWTHLLGCIVFLSTGKGPKVSSDALMDSNGREQSPRWEGSNSSSNTPALDCASTLSATSRTLYCTALKQSRYAAHLTVLVLHFSYDCIDFSDMISDLLLDALFQCSAENTAHIFSIMEAFLSISDRHQSHRAVSMFKSDSGPLNMLKGIHEQAPKKRLVCVCIRSLMTLVQRVSILREALTTPSSVIQTWAPWMLKFAFLFMNDCAMDSASATADRKAYSPHAHLSSDDNSALKPIEKEKGN